MNFIKILLVFSDRRYAEEAARTLCRASGFLKPVISDTVAPGFDVLISDESAVCASYGERSVLMDCTVSSSSLVSRVCDIAAASGLSVPFCAKSGGAGEFCLFTSAGGGQGTSTCAILFSRCLSALEGKRVLFLSFDPFTTDGDYSEAGENAAGADAFLLSLFDGKTPQDELKNLFCRCVSTDVYGVSSFSRSNSINPLSLLGAGAAKKLLSFAAGSGMFDSVVIDASSRYSGLFEISPLCEHRIVVGRGNDRGAASLLLTALSAQDGARLFSPEFDEDAASLDIFSQLGTEVKTLVESVAGA